MTDEQFEYWHDRAYQNAKEMLNGWEPASCFYCLKEFKRTSITKWTDNGETAICPHCNNDTVLPGQWSQEFLNNMRKYWFGEKLEVAESRYLINSSGTIIVTNNTDDYINVTIDYENS